MLSVILVGVRITGNKLSTWHDQLGSSGCVGCGRCIAWCPTGIDITEEMATFARLAEASEGPADE
mgnify:CR=1 FL=1